MKPIIDAASEGRLVVFVGAGVSTIPPTSLPSWWDVNERVVAALAERIAPLVGEDRAISLAKAVRDRQHADRFPPEYQAELLASRLGTSYFRVLQCLDSDRPNAVHLRLARLGAAGYLAAIVTTNFDRALETAFRAAGCELRVCARAREFEALAPDLEEAGGRLHGCVLLKLHGSAEDPVTLVDTLAQRKRGLPPSAIACLRTLLYTSHWLFLGWSGADLDANDGYLGLGAAYNRARGFTWLFRATEQPRPAVTMIREAYGDRAAVVHGELPGWLTETTAPLLPPDCPLSDNTDPEELKRRAQEQIAAHARTWAEAIGTTDCALGLADILVAVGEPHSAVALLRGALEDLAEQEHDGRDGVKLGCALAADLADLGEDAQALVLYNQAIQTLGTLGELDRVAEVRLNVGLIHQARGDYEAARQAFESLLGAAERSGDEVKRSVALHNLGLLHGTLGEFDRGELLFRQEIEILHQLGDEPNEAVAYNDLGELLGRASRFDAAIEVLAKAVSIRTRLGNDRGRAMSLGNLAQVHFLRGDLDSAVRTYREVIDIFARLGDKPNRAKTMGNLAVVAVRQGRPDEAIPLLREAISSAEALGREPECARLLMNLGEALREIGSLEESRTVLLRALASWEGLRTPPGRAEAQLELGLTYWRLNQLEDAERLFRGALDTWERLGSDAGIARASMNLGLLAQQRGNLDQALALFRRSNDIDARLGVEGGVLRAQLNMGNIALLQGRLEEAVAAYTSAREIADRVNLPLEAAGARAAAAYALGLQGRLAASLDAFRDAEAHATGPATLLGLAARLGSLAEIYAANGHAEPAALFASEAARLREAAKGAGPR